MESPLWPRLLLIFKGDTLLSFAQLVCDNRSTHFLVVERRERLLTTFGAHSLDTLCAPLRSELLTSGIILSALGLVSNKSSTKGTIQALALAVLASVFLGFGGVCLMNAVGVYA
jgi:hypothetical protein